MSVQLLDTGSDWIAICPGCRAEFVRPTRRRAVVALAAHVDDRERCGRLVAAARVGKTP